VDFRMLGPLEVGDGESRVRLPARKPGALLARLLLDANRPVAVARNWPPSAGSAAAPRRSTRSGR
jgi:hypothetical protein